MQWVDTRVDIGTARVGIGILFCRHRIRKFLHNKTIQRIGPLKLITLLEREKLIVKSKQSCHLGFSVGSFLFVTTEFTFNSIRYLTDPFQVRPYILVVEWHLTIRAAMTRMHIVQESSMNLCSTLFKTLRSV